MYKILISASALVLAATGAQAQLLGGGLGGMGSGTGSIGGNIGGIGDIGGIGQSAGRAGDTLRSTSRNTADGAASTNGSQSVDRRSGRVEVSRSANGSASAGSASLLGTPIMPVAGNAGGSASGSGNGTASAGLIGTDAVRGAAGRGANEAREGASQARDVTGSRLGALRETAGSAANGAGTATGNGTAGGAGTASSGLGAMPGQLAASGSAAAAGGGAFAVAPRMPVLDADGDRIGRVRELVADGTGRVREVVVQTRDGLATIPVSNFSANGSALVSAMSEAELRDAASEEPAAE